MGSDAVCRRRGATDLLSIAESTSSSPKIERHRSTVGLAGADAIDMAFRPVARSCYRLPTRTRTRPGLEPKSATSSPNCPDDRPHGAGLPSKLTGHEPRYNPGVPAAAGTDRARSSPRIRAGLPARTWPSDRTSADGEHTICRIGALTSADALGRVAGSCYYTTRRDELGSVGEVEVEEPWRFGQVEAGEDAFLARGDGGG